MKKIGLICAFLFFLNAQSQEAEYQIYDEAIIQIKKSEMFKEYSIQNESLNNHFKVSWKMYPICELHSFFKKKMNSKIFDYCQSNNWMDEEVLSIRSLRKKSDKGKKSFDLRFTTTLENYFIAEVKFKSATNNSLIYLFETKENKTVLIDVGNVFYD